MKKTLLFLIAATAMMMAGCSNDDFGGATQGMTLNATVEQPASRAIMTDPNDGTYKFSFDNGDELNVTNSKVESYYTFTKNGDTFTSANAQTTTALADWYAYFPGNTVNLAGQKGDLAGVANYYACAGKTASATTGADGLTIALTPQVAILCEQVRHLLHRSTRRSRDCHLQWRNPGQGHQEGCRSYSWQVLQPDHRPSDRRGLCNYRWYTTAGKVGTAVGRRS